MSRVCVYTAISGEDECWVDQYLSEMERLDMPFVMHFDRCGRALQDRIGRHRLCVGTTTQNDPAREFTEQHKQKPLDKVTAFGFGWAMATDIDEVYEGDAAAKITIASESAVDWLDIRWLNLWGDDKHIRVDGNWCLGHRVRFLNLGDGRRWHFDHPITNGPKLVGRESKGAKFDLVCLHHGLMTPELRALHKERWDRIYSTALRGDPNPYHAWKDAIETASTAVTVRHGYR